MPDTGWNSYVIATVADVRERWLSPETLLAANAASDIPIGVVVNTNAFTSGIPHGMATWTSVRFTGDTLPAGLTANVTYYIRDVTESTFRVASVIGGGALLVANGDCSVYNYALNDLLERKMALGKEWLYDKLLGMVADHVNALGAISWNWQNDFQINGQPVIADTPLERATLVLDRLANPEKLKHVLVDFTGLALAADGRFRNQITDSFAADAKRAAAKDLKAEASDRLDATAPLLYVQTSTDTRGLFSFAATNTTVSTGLF